MEERWNARRKRGLNDLKKDGYKTIHHEKKYFKDTLHVALRRHHEVDVLRGFA